LRAVVNPMLVGRLFDLGFEGQSIIALADSPGMRAPQHQHQAVVWARLP
jgi:hypothetical protein